VATRQIRLLSFALLPIIRHR